MKHIKITIEVDGNTLTRTLSYESDPVEEIHWAMTVDSMLDTIEKSNDPLK